MIIILTFIFASIPESLALVYGMYTLSKRIINFPATLATILFFELTEDMIRFKTNIVYAYPILYTVLFLFILFPVALSLFKRSVSFPMFYLFYILISAGITFLEFAVMLPVSLVSHMSIEQINHNVFLNSCLSVIANAICIFIIKKGGDKLCSK